MQEWLWSSTGLWWAGAWGSVVLPVLVCTVVLGLRPVWALDRTFWLLVVVSACVTFLTGYWRISSEEVSLHLLPVFLLVTAFMGLRQCVMSPGQAYVGGFVSLVVADVAQALFRASQGADLSLVYVGGAGLQDGLFVFPVLGAMLMVYVRWRIGQEKVENRLAIEARPIPSTP